MIIEALIGLNSILVNTFSLIDESDPTRSTIYSSGLDDKETTKNLLPASSFALLRIPVKFKVNEFSKPLREGFYELQPIFNKNIPIKINFRQVGKIIGSATVVDYKVLKSKRKNAIAEFNNLNNSNMAQINLKIDKYEIYAIIKRF